MARPSVGQQIRHNIRGGFDPLPVGLQIHNKIRGITDLRLGSDLQQESRRSVGSEVRLEIRNTSDLLRQLNEVANSQQVSDAFDIGAFKPMGTIR